MRVLTGLIAVVLLIVAILGMSFGVWAIVKAASMPTPDGRAMGMLGALTIGALPFLAGTVALAGVGAMFSTEQLRAELAEARASDLAAESARRRHERQQDPAFRAQVDAVKAEQAKR